MPRLSCAKPLTPEISQRCEGSHEAQSPCTSACCFTAISVRDAAVLWALTAIRDRVVAVIRNHGVHIEVRMRRLLTVKIGAYCDEPTRLSSETAFYGLARGTRQGRTSRADAS